MDSLCNICMPSVKENGREQFPHFTLLCEDGAQKKVLHCNGQTDDDARQWLDSYSELTKTTWRVLRTYPESGKKIVFKIMYRCQHNSMYKRPETVLKRHLVSEKNTECKATMTITVKRIVKYSRSNDKHLLSLPMEIILKNSHNHPILCSEAVRHRDVRNDIREKFVKLYESVYAPASALKLHKDDLFLENGDQALEVFADRAVCPDIYWCHRLYTSLFKESYGDRNTALEMLQNLLKTYDPDGKYAATHLENNYFVVAIITPLMARNHKLNSRSGELNYIDSSGNMDREQCRVFIILSDSEAGGLPLGILITSSETEKNITMALNLYKSLLQKDSYYGRDVVGPQNFITDDCTALRNALHSVFPSANRFLCIFHILQAVYRYISKSESGIPLNARQEALQLVKQIMFCFDASNVHNVYEMVMHQKVVENNPKFKAYLQNLFERKELWVLAFRQNTLIRGHNTNNMCEAAMRIMKDTILQRLRAYNLNQLIHFIFTRVENYYAQRLIDTVNDRDVRAYKRFHNDKVLPKALIIQLDKTTYQVKQYIVNTEVWVCTCPVGFSGNFCKHQDCVAFHYNLNSYGPVKWKSPSRKLMLYEIASNIKISNLEFFAPLHSNFLLDRACDALTDASCAEERLGQPSIHMLDSVDTVPGTFNSSHLMETDSGPSTVFNQTIEPDRSQQLCNIENKFCGLFKKWQTMYGDDATFLKDMSTFMANAEKMHTTSKISSALNTFGKFTGFSTKGTKKALSSAKRIGVQPTAIQRRKCALGGRKPLSGGRIPKSSFVPEHGYATSMKKRVKMPHSLAFCTSMNRSLGGTHSKK